MKWKKLKDNAEEVFIMKKTMSVYLFWYSENKLWEAWLLDKSGTTSKLIAKGKNKERVREKAEVWLYQGVEEIFAGLWD